MHLQHPFPIFFRNKNHIILDWSKLRFVSHDAAGWAQTEKILPGIVNYFTHDEIILHRFVKIRNIFIAQAALKLWFIDKQYPFWGLERAVSDSPDPQLSHQYLSLVHSPSVGALDHFCPNSRGKWVPLKKTFPLNNYEAGIWSHLCC